jgi:L,D-transpeptidase ErfK/SrfK
MPDELGHSGKTAGAGARAGLVRSRMPPGPPQAVAVLSTIVLKARGVRAAALCLRLAGAALSVAVLLLGAIPARAAVYELTDPSVQVVGEDLHLKTRYEDTLVDIARRYGLGYEEITRANPGVDPWLPGEGTQIVIPGRRILPPGPRAGIVVNIPEHRLYYYPKPKRGQKPVVVTYPVSIGKMDWKTPLGATRIVSKQKNPFWYPPESVRKEHAANGDPIPAIVKPGPDNPLGAYAMRMAIHPGDYLIHGTNNPLAVGMPVTHGCIRMYPEDIAAFFPTVPVGTTVRLINEPVKVAYVDGELLLEAHPPVDDQGQTVEPVLADFEQLLDQALGSSTAAIHWDYAIETLKTANGIPVTVGLEAAPDAPSTAGTAPSAPTPSAATPSAAAPSASAPAPSAATAEQAPAAPTTPAATVEPAAAAPAPAAAAPAAAAPAAATSDSTASPVTPPTAAAQPTADPKLSPAP